MDAVVTAQTVLSVVEPQSSGLGGGGFLLYWDQKKQNLFALDGRETASSRAQKDTWIGSDGKPIAWLKARRSLTSIGVPGTAALLWEGHRKFGLLPWKYNLKASIQIAKEGFIPSPRFLKSISLAKKIGINHSPGFKDLYLPNGQLPSKKHHFKNQELASTLNNLATKGVDTFYRGEISKKIINDIERLQNKDNRVSAITLEDLANYQVYERKPLCRLYKVWRVCSFPPPSGGGVAVLQSLGIFEVLTAKTISQKLPIHWHLISESLRHADADRSHWIGDPIDLPVPLNGLVDDNYIKARALGIHLNKAKHFPPPGKPKGGEKLDLASQPRTTAGGTTHLVVVDKQGNVASYTGSVESVFGSGYISGGMVLNNQLTDFSFVSSYAGKKIANRVGANKRPMSSMSPIIVFHNKVPILAIGSPGGWIIPHFLTSALINALDLNLSPKEVVSSKHLSVRPDQTLLEENSEWSTSKSSTRQTLQQSGHQIKTTRFSSGLAIIQRKGKVWHGAADPRREGKAVSLP